MLEKESENGGDKNGSSDSDSARAFLARLALNSGSTAPSGDNDSSGNTDGGGGGTGGTSGIKGAGIGIPNGPPASRDSGNDSSGNIPDAGTSSDVRSGSGSGGTDYTGRRGRHGRDCICERCSDRRAAESGSQTGSETDSTARTQKRRRATQEAIPEYVDWKDIFPGMQEGKAPKIDDLLSLAYSSLFELAKFARKEDHWQLTQEEAKKLGKVTVGCINTVPLATKTKIVQKFDKYLPWIALVGFGAVITYPRIALSIEIEKQRKRSRFPAPIPIRSDERDSRVTGETFRDSAGIPENATNENRGASFPPGHLKNAPPLDYVIP